MTIEEMISFISKNNMGEQEAITGYFLLLLESRKHGLPNEFYKQIEEIISDEMNHSIVLSEWVTKLSKIKPNET